jgi:3-dehydroquinate dehydratase-1
MNMLLCGCVVEEKKQDAIDSIALAKKMGADIIELRIDRLENPEDAAEIINHSPLPAIATLRREKDGGRQIDERQRAELLKSAISAGAKFVDLELDMDELLFETLSIIARDKDCKVICSFHDFGKTPQNTELKTIIDQLNTKGDIGKLVSKANSIEDCHRVLGLLSKKNNLVAFCMGEIGRFTRIVSLIQGSSIGYCKIKEEAAIGQFSITETKDLLGRLS